MQNFFNLLRSPLLRLMALALLALGLVGTPMAQAMRIKEVAAVQGVRSNQLTGYGLVVGLDGTGDQTTQMPYTSQSLNNYLQQLGITLPAGTELTVRRIFIRQGARDFDSMTFTATIPPLKPAPRGKVAKPKSVRFWAKLDDCNTMEVVHAGGVVS